MKSRLLLTLLTLTSIALPQWSLAQGSKISQVLVYPGGATVERVAKVAAGSQTLKLSCLTTRFDLDSLQLQGDAGTQIGDVSVQTMARERAPECAASPLDARIRELEDSQAAIKAEIDAQDLVLGFLKNIGGGNGGATQANIGSTAEALRRSGLDAMQRQHQLLRKKQLIEQDLSPLLAERERLIKANPQVRQVQIRLAAPQAGELRLSYRLTQAGWTPVYRAHLDTSKAQLRLERQAQVAQNSGEDWVGVKLRLSTVQPRQNTGITPPRPWTLDILPPIQPQQEMQMLQAPRAMAAAAAPPPFIPPPEFNVAAPEARFDVSVFQGTFSAEFAVPGLASIASDGQRVGYSLGSELIEAQVWRRVQPQQEAQAYLLAKLARPAGSWPSGSLQLFRDGDFVGNSHLNMGSDERLELFFGRDDMLRVKAEPEQRGGANAGFIGARAEQKISRAFVIENLHKTPVQLQVLEAAPVARHEDIRVQTSFKPEPSDASWKKQPGVVAWALPLEAGKTLRITADYLISYPKDARISGLR